MNKRLQKAIEKAPDKYGIEYLHDEDFTICILWEGAMHNIEYFGITKRNPAMDEHDVEFAHSVALARAVKKTLRPKRKKGNGK